MSVSGLAKSLGEGPWKRWLPTAALVFFARGAMADEDPIRLEWDAPPGCPSESDVRGAIRRWLKPATDAKALRSIRADAKIHESSDGWVLELSLESAGGNGGQTVSSQQCQTLADIVALNVALAANPATTMQAIGTSPPARSGASVGNVLIAVRAAGGVSLGPMPGVAPGAALFVAVGTRRERLELGASYLPPREVRYDDPRQVGANLDLLAGTLRACAVPFLGSVEFPVCAGVDVGDLRARGFGIEQSETAHRLSLGLDLGPAMDVPLVRGFYACLQGEAVFALTRPSYRVRNLDELYRVGPASARAWAGLEYRFP